ncbi:Multicopper oxidase [Acidisarcina polymorpha]|uniref:Multicopper oxidase n=1 Tax=Acidisarcina polymorpha TaxID=2211140 RepID=A0A2Z5FXJ8_9BACT|nr:multicopper oxidase domain-containing protein [Acidisarcina polymorpha]AXC11581.1 Multicopper oxidase [Acidisarcina polymorpha]
MRFLSASAQRSVFCQLALPLLVLTPASIALAQLPGGMHAMAAPALAQESYSSFASATPAADPADSVCARQPVGSVISSPSQLTSTNGVLETTFSFKRVVDQAGLTRYCYISNTGVQAPTLRVNPGDQLIIHFVNDIPASAAVKAQAMPGMVMKGDAAAAASSDCSATSVGATSTNMHFHGLNVSPACHQDEVIHTIIQPGASFDYTVQIPANEPSGMYWYHPHPHGFSQSQVLGGATGIIIVEGIQNFNSAVAGLPERILVIRDQALTSAEQKISGAQPGDDLSLNYVPVNYPKYTPGVIQTPPATKEFWRVANTSANSLINLEVNIGATHPTLQIVATDGVPVTDGSGNPTTLSAQNVVLPPGARVEFILVTPNAGQGAQLIAQTWNNGPQGDADPGRPLANIVASASTSDGGLPRTSGTPVTIPAVNHSLPPLRFKALDSAAATVQRNLYFSIKSDFSQFYITVAGQTPAPFSMDGPPNITVHAGTVEQWTISNHSLMDHAFHIHQIHFRTLAINGSPVTDYTERDTINVPHWSGSGAYPSVTLLMDFSDPDIVGTFVYHCHILSHEDLGMMGSIQVLPSTSPAPTLTSISRKYGAYGAVVTVNGTNLGATQGNSTLTFNGVPASSTSFYTMTWSNTSITTTVPARATTGDVVVTVAGNTSNGFGFVVYPDPVITRISPTSGPAGTVVTVTGTALMDPQGQGLVTLNNVTVPFTGTQSNTALRVIIPKGATSGELRVHASGAGDSNAASTFTVN